MITTFVLCGLFAAALAAPVTDRVCAPPQWEAKVFAKIAQVSGNQPIVIGMLGNSSSDFTNKKMAIFEVIEYNGMLIRIHYIIDYNKVRRKVHSV